MYVKLCVLIAMHINYVYWFVINLVVRVSANVCQIMYANYINYVYLFVIKLAV